jgi:hypothetical protein
MKCLLEFLDNVLGFIRAYLIFFTGKTKKIDFLKLNTTQKKQILVKNSKLTKILSFSRCKETQLFSW